MFNDSQIQQFHELGYLSLPEFWTEDEVRGMRLELEDLIQQDKLHNVTTDGDGVTPSKTKQNLQICPISPHSRFFRAMPYAPKVLEAVQQLIGDPVMLHLDQAFWKPGKSGAGTNWHQDNAYFKISDPLKGTAIWSAVHEATIDNGTMHIIPGSHRTEYEHSRDPESDHHIRCYPEEEKAIPVELPAGGVLFFAYGVVHSTKANNTENPRAGVALHFLNSEYAHNDLVEPDRDARPYMSGPLATGGLREYGELVAGTWPAELEARLGSI